MSGQIVIPTGFEKFFIESWSGWDELDFLVSQFYECKLKSDFAVELDHEKVYNVCINLGNNVITVFDDEEDDVVMEFTITNIELAKLEKSE